MEDHVVHRALQVPDVDPEPGAGVALRVEVDDEHPVAEVGEAGAQVHGRGGLADAALLVGDRHDAGERPGERRRLLVGRRPASAGAGSSAGVAAPRAARRSAAPRRRRRSSTVRQIRRAREGTAAPAARQGPGARAAAGSVKASSSVVGQRRASSAAFRRPPVGGARRVRRSRDRVAPSEPLEDGPPPGGQIVLTSRSPLHPARWSARAQGPCAMFHVELSTSVQAPRDVPRGTRRVRRAAAWPGARRGGGRSPGSGHAARSTWTRGAVGRPRPDRSSPSRASPAAGQRAGSGCGRLAHDQPTRRRASSGARALGGRGRGAEAAGDDGVGGAPERPVADHLGATLDHLDARSARASTAASRNRQRFARGVEQDDARGRAGPRRGPARARRRRCRGRRPCPWRRPAASRKRAPCARCGPRPGPGPRNPSARARSSCVSSGGRGSSSGASVEPPGRSGVGDDDDPAAAGPRPRRPCARRRSR